MSGERVRTYTGDAWYLHASGAWLVDPTNLTLTKKGAAVMGGGLSRAVRERFPEIDVRYGAIISERIVPGLTVGYPADMTGLTRPLLFAAQEERILLCPVKLDWHAPARLDLIEIALAELGDWVAASPTVEIALPHIGCGLGGLDWAVDVRPLVRDWLRAMTPDIRGRIIIVSADKTPATVA